MVTLKRGKRRMCLIALMTWMVRLVCTCPDDILGGIYTCLSDLASTEEIAMPNSHHCDGHFDVTLSCIQDIKYTCRHDNKGLDLIRRTVDLAKLQSAFQHMCLKLQELDQSADCISQYKDKINKCCASVAKEFHREKQLAHSAELYLKLICGFMDDITRCTEQPVRRYCSPESADLTVRLMSAMKPPSCPVYSDADLWSAPPVFTITVAMLALSFVIT